MCLFLFSSLFYFQLYLIDKSNKNLIKSTILYALLILTYEISYLLIIIYFITTYFKFNSIKHCFYKTKYHLIFLFIVLIITLYFRLTIDGAGYPSIDKSFLNISFFKAFLFNFFLVYLLAI